MKQKSIKKAIKEYFFIYPLAKLRVRQIERELGMSLPSVIRSVNDLVKEDILKKVNIGNVVFYTSNRGSSEFVFEKKLFNIRSIHRAGLVEFLIEELGNPQIALFGSYSKGEDQEGSDIDLYVETLSKKEISLERFERALKRKIQLFRFQRIDKLGNPHLANNILNGIILNGFVEVFR